MRACACPFKHHNREGGNALSVPLQHQKQTGNSKLGLSSCRESHRQKGGKAQGDLYPAQGGSSARFLGGLSIRPFCYRNHISGCLLDDQGSLEVTLLNQLVITTNVTTGTGREEGRKEERKEELEEGVCQPGFEPVLCDLIVSG